MNIGRGETRVEPDALIETHPIELAGRTMVGGGRHHGEHRDQKPG